ncbi:MAG TPA: CbiX/SirB N-terminal domain-containing protein [Bryobacteraceae bacterium]|jgi:sirohydrochlorin ferrochelatase|nr:CbiX/SirB N-terminal domain-containing protein [Bryobacteraceae bacterium]
MTGLAIFAHGSSVSGANDQVKMVTAQLAARGNFSLIETAFLELAEPDLAEASRRLVERGATSIVVVPYFLTLGIHLRRDLPRIVDELRLIYSDIEFRITEPLDGHPALVDILLARAEQAFHGSSNSASTID